MKKVRILVLFVLICISVIGFLFLRDYYKTDISKENHPIVSNVIEYKADDTIHFFPSGFAVSSQIIRFYNYEGILIDIPFDEALHEITHSAGHFMVFDNRVIYNTKVTPFEKIWESDTSNIIDIRAHDSNILLILETDEYKLTPYYLETDSGSIHAFEGIGTTNILDASYVSTGNHLSLLMLDTESPFPISRIFHYSDLINPYGVLTLENTLLHSIYRTNSHVILVGNNQVLCYNIDGSFAWDFLIPSGAQYQIHRLKDAVLVYFPDKTIGDDGENAIITSADGDYSLYNLPENMTFSGTSNNKFIASGAENQIYVISDKGRMIDGFTSSDLIRSVYISEYDYNNIYISTQNDFLNIYRISD